MKVNMTVEELLGLADNRFDLITHDIARTGFLQGWVERIPGPTPEKQIALREMIVALQEIERRWAEELGEKPKYTFPDEPVIPPYLKRCAAPRVEIVNVATAPEKLSESLCTSCAKHETRCQFFFPKWKTAITKCAAYRRKGWEDGKIETPAPKLTPLDMDCAHPTGTKVTLNGAKGVVNLAGPTYTNVNWEGGTNSTVSTKSLEVSIDQPKVVPEELWVTNNEGPVLVGKMTETHARNTLRMLIRQIRKGDLHCLGSHKHRITRARRQAGFE